MAVFPTLVIISTHIDFSFQTSSVNMATVDSSEVWRTLVYEIKKLWNHAECRAVYRINTTNNIEDILRRYLHD